MERLVLRRERLVLDRPPSTAVLGVASGCAALRPFISRACGSGRRRTVPAGRVRAVWTPISSFSSQGRPATALHFSPALPPPLPGRSWEGEAEP